MVALVVAEPKIEEHAEGLDSIVADAQGGQDRRKLSTRRGAALAAADRLMEACRREEGNHDERTWKNKCTIDAEQKLLKAKNETTRKVTGGDGGTTSACPGAGWGSAAERPVL